MKILTFKRESNDFTDILTDPVISKHIEMKLKWETGLIINLSLDDEKLLSYIELKYGDSIYKMCKDLTPIPFVDYLPRKPELSADKC